MIGNVCKIILYYIHFTCHIQRTTNIHNSLFTAREIHRIHQTMKFMTPISFCHSALMLSAGVSRLCTSLIFRPILFGQGHRRGSFISKTMQSTPLITNPMSRAFISSTLITSTSANNDDMYQPIFEKGDKVQVEIISFGRLGASVDVIAHNSHDPKECIPADEPALGRGLILQKEIAYYRDKRSGVDIVQYETLPAYVEKVREQEFEEGKGIEVRLDISLRPIGGRAKALELGEQIMRKLKEEGGVLEIGDKSSPEDINSFFPGASKNAFKRAVSSLYKQEMVNPGPNKISLMKK